MVQLGHHSASSCARVSLQRAIAALCVLSFAAVAGGCAGSGVSEPIANWNTNVSAEPQFPESKWKVKASPRVASSTSQRASGGYKIGKPYQVGDKWYHPREQPDYDRIGVASWYGENFHGRKTANGEIYDMHKLTAAHPTLPMPSYVYVTNIKTNRTVLVRVNDRGPYVKERMIDLSKATADALQLSGTAKVRVRYAGPAPLDGDDRRERHFLATGQDLGAPAPQAPRLASAAEPPFTAPSAQGPGPGGQQLTWQASPLGGPQMPPPAEGEPLFAAEPPQTTSALNYGGEAAAPAPTGGYSGWDAASYRAGRSAR